ncbi:hypothetical protein GCM10009841_14740 [Microlunatus panaciterrae]|uniref:DUF4129 domain-containing protein n=1 Tax=Microlunatus panaciterrae TaxID=400768 RepID=A0ABS2RLZ6_9ACTN|nr:hypothetical protein [Microlunatus panaciterrae]MBM7800034.1 hypothetical protein [Microlunatus panaciterrae]
MMDFEAQRIRRTRVVWVVVLSVLVPVAAFVVGVNWVQCLLLGTATATVGGLLALLPAGEDVPWEPPDDQIADGARREVTRLSWTLGGHENRVGEAPLRRLRELAVTRLAARGVQVDDPAGRETAARLLGDQVWAVLTAETGPPPRFDTFVRCVDALERLDTLPSGDHPDHAHRPRPYDNPTVPGAPSW